MKFLPYVLSASLWLLSTLSVRAADQIAVSTTAVTPAAGAIAVGDGTNWIAGAIIAGTNTTVTLVGTNLVISSTASGSGSVDAGDLTGNTLAAGVTKLGSQTSNGLLHTINGDGSLVVVAITSVPNGGTGAGTFTDGGVLLGNGTGAFSVTTVGVAGEVLTSNGPGVDPTFQAAAGGGDALTASSLDQFANVTQTAGQTLAITSSTTLNGGTHSGTNTGDQTTVTGNAGTATALATGRTIAITGDLTYTSPSFDGSGNVTAAGTLATVNSDVGSFGNGSFIPTITVNAKGLITAVTTNAVTAGGTGDVVGPASSTDNAVVRFDSTTGKLLQNSAVTIADTTGDITGGKYNTVTISGSATPTLAVSGTTSVSGANTGDETAAGILAKLITVDGAGSGLDADLLDGSSSAAFQPVDAALTALAGGSDFVAFSGPSASTKNFTLPNASATVLTDNAAVTVAQGGTGAATLGDAGVLIGNGTGAVQVTSAGTATHVLTSNGAGVDPTFQANPRYKYVPAGFTVDGGGSAVTTGKVKGFTVARQSGTITSWSISVDTGTCTVKVWKVATGTAVPTISNVINTSGVAISSGTHIHSTTTSDFTTTTVAANDIIAYDITAVSGATEISFGLEITSN